MPSTLSQGWAARLVAVVAVLAGLALLHTPRCVDGMTDVLTATMTAPSPATAPVVAHHSGLGSTEPGAPAPDDGGGLLATCLAFIVAALVALVAPARPEASGRAEPSQPPGWVASTSVSLAPGPDLSRLGVLRI